MSEQRDYLTLEDQFKMNEAAAKTIANLAVTLPPFLKALQDMAVAAIPALRASIEPMQRWMEENREALQDKENDA